MVPSIMTPLGIIFFVRRAMMDKQVIDDGKSFFNAQMFAVVKNGYVVKTFGDPISLAELGMLVFERNDLDEQLFNIYVPDDVNYLQLETFERNSVASEVINWKYRVFYKKDGIYTEYNCLEHGIVPNAVISSLIYGKIIEREDKKSKRVKQ